MGIRNTLDPKVLAPSHASLVGAVRGSSTRMPAWAARIARHITAWHFWTLGRCCQSCDHPSALLMLGSLWGWGRGCAASWGTGHAGCRQLGTCSAHRWQPLIHLLLHGRGPLLELGGSLLELRGHLPHKLLWGPLVVGERRLLHLGWGALLEGGRLLPVLHWGWSLVVDRSWRLPEALALLHLGGSCRLGVDPRWGCSRPASC